MADSDSQGRATGRLSQLAQAARALLPRSRRLARLRKLWGAVGDADSWLASRFFDLCPGGGAGAVDDRTWGDLELPAVFRQLDTTVTRLGSQCLYRQLRTYDF